MSDSYSRYSSSSYERHKDDRYRRNDDRYDRHDRRRDYDRDHKGGRGRDRQDDRYREDYENRDRRHDREYTGDREYRSRNDKESDTKRYSSPSVRQSRSSSPPCETIRKEKTSILPTELKDSVRNGVSIHNRTPGIVQESNQVSRGELSTFAEPTTKEVKEATNRTTELPATDPQTEVSHFALIATKVLSLTSTQEQKQREEKLRARQEKLRLWQLKKEAEKEAIEKRRSETPPSEIETKGSTTASPTSNNLNVKLTESNQSQQIKIMASVSTNANTNVKLGFNRPKLNGQRRPVAKPIINIKRRAFTDDGDDDDEEANIRRRPLPKLTPAPFADDTTGYSVNKIVPDNDDDTSPMQVDEVDPLDAFMAEMKEEVKTVKTTAAPLPSAVNDEEEERNNDIENLNVIANDDIDDPEAYMRMIENKKKKDVIQVDHAKINYEPFRKKFYVEPQELSDMTPEEVDMLRLELDGIKTAGVDCPKPVIKWEQFGLPQPTMQVIRSLGYEKPTSIQAQAIPAIMSGRDVIGVAKTGSGKTMAFLLPLFRHIKDQRPIANMDGPISIIMTPTRELAVQIFKECRPFLKALDLKAMCAYGGSPIKEQIAELKRGVEIIVCTPGRMIDLLAANSGRVTNLRRITYLVLDEADRMFDMGFEPQVMKIVKNIRPDRQTVLFSATFPRQMEALARKTLEKPVEIIVGARSVVAPEITQIVEVRADNEKFLRVLEVLGDFYYQNEGKDARALIFVDRQEAADELLKSLIARGYPCLSIHGGKDQVDRDSAINDFKRGVASLLIATSVAARGLDVKQLKLVINYDAPNHMEDYVHRVGRTGRAGNTGTAVTFITPDQERNAMDIAKALKLSKCPVPDDVKDLANKFFEKIRSGKQKFGASGFGGRGLEKLDVVRDSKKNKERKAFGEEDDDGEKEGNNSDGEVDEIIVGATVRPAPGPTSQELLDKTAVITSGTETSNLKGRIVAGQSSDNLGPDAGKFYTTLEINDLPQKARWAVTSNSSVVKLVDSFSCSFTPKGEYYPPGQVPGENAAPKLYLLIEGQTEESVAKAHKALVSLAKAAIEAEEMDKRSSGTSGRYSI